MISTKTIDIGGHYKKVARHTGIDSRPDVLTVPIGIPDLKQAVDNCIEEGKGELLTDAVVDFVQWTAIVYGQRKYSVTGDVWVKASMSDIMNPNEELFELQASTHGYALVSLSDPTQVVKVEYLASR